MSRNRILAVYGDGRGIGASAEIPAPATLFDLSPSFFLLVQVASRNLGTHELFTGKVERVVIKRIQVDDPSTLR